MFGGSPTRSSGAGVRLPPIDTASAAASNMLGVPDAEDGHLHTGQRSFREHGEAEPNRKALLIGINYKRQRGELRGCINDVVNMTRVLLRKGVPEENIVTLTDETRDKPTKKNIVAGIEWLIEGAKAGDMLHLHYSGHGTQSPQKVHGDELDRMNEALVPLDHNNCRNLIDDELLSHLLFERIPDDVLLTVVMDCCHSGTMIDDMAVKHHTHGKRPSHKHKRRGGVGGGGAHGTRGFGGDPGYDSDSEDSDTILASLADDPEDADVNSNFGLPPGSRSRHLPLPPDVLQEHRQRGFSLKQARKAPKSSLARDDGVHKDDKSVVILFSGCRDHQTSADAYIEGQYTGAFSWGLIKTLEEHDYDITYNDLIHEAQSKMKKSRYSQDPLLSTHNSDYLHHKFLEPVHTPAPSAATTATAPAAAAATTAAATTYAGSPAHHSAAFPSSAVSSTPSPTKAAARPSVGILVDNAPYGNGVEVLQVRPSALGQRAGLRKGDIIESLAYRRTRGTTDFKAIVSDTIKWGATIPIGIRRGYSRLNLSLVIPEKPAAAAAPATSVSPTKYGNASSYGASPSKYGSGAYGSSAAYGASPNKYGSAGAPAAAPSSGMGVSGMSMSSGGGGSAGDVSRLRPVIGISVMDDPSGAGVVVTNVLRGGPAFKAGVRGRDVILEIARRPTTSRRDFERVCDAVAQVGVILPFLIQRGMGAPVKINVEVDGRRQ